MNILRKYTCLSILDSVTHSSQFLFQPWNQNTPNIFTPDNYKEHIQNLSSQNLSSLNLSHNKTYHNNKNLQKYKSYHNVLYKVVTQKRSNTFFFYIYNKIHRIRVNTTTFKFLNYFLTHLCIIKYKIFVVW